jgi:hypothetical protein
MARRRSQDWDDSEDDGRDADGDRGDDAMGGEDADLEDADLEDADLDDAGRQRRSSETGYCPECGAEIYDAADICPKCFTWIDGNTTHRRPSRMRSSLRVAVVVALLVVILGGVGFFAFVQLAGN